MIRSRLYLPKALLRGNSGAIRVARFLAQQAAVEVADLDRSRPDKQTAVDDLAIVRKGERFGDLPHDAGDHEGSQVGRGAHVARERALLFIRRD